MPNKIKHDKFFQKALSNPIVAREFFNMHLPSHIKVLFLPSTLKLENDSFIEPSLKETITDVLYSAKINNRDGYIYICVNIKVVLHSYGFSLVQIYVKYC